MKTGAPQLDRDVTVEEKRAHRLERQRARRAADPEGERERQRAWRQANPEKEAAQGKRHRERHKEKIAARMAAWREKNLNRLLAYSREYEATHKEARGAYHREHAEAYAALARRYYAEDRGRRRVRRRALYVKNLEEMRKQGREKVQRLRRQHPEWGTNARARRRLRMAAGFVPLRKGEWQAIQNSYLGLCVYCGKRPARLTPDHVVPLGSGGTHVGSNLAPACLPCNMSKGKKSLLLWIAQTTRIGGGR